jgi:hypothetical protein
LDCADEGKLKINIDVRKEGAKFKLDDKGLEIENEDVKAVIDSSGISIKTKDN